MKNLIAVNKKWIKLIPLVFVLLILVACSRILEKIPSGMQNEATGEARQTYEVYLDLASEDNLFFSTYDIEVFLDGEEVGSIPNGKHLTAKINVLKGEHELTVYKSGDHNLSANKKFSINGPTTIQASVLHESKRIGYKDFSILDNVNGAQIEMINAEGMVLSEAKKQLKAAGFVNINPEPNGDIFDSDNWRVLTQNVEAGVKIDKNTYIQLDCVHLDQYYEEALQGKTLLEAERTAAENGFSLVYKNSKDYSDCQAIVDALSEEEKEEWIVENTSIGSINSAIVYLLCQRAPNEDEAIVPLDHKECLSKDFQEVNGLFESAGFTNIHYEILYDNSKQGSVKEVTVRGKDSFYKDDLIPKDSRIVISYYMKDPNSQSTGGTGSSQGSTSALTVDNSKDLAELLSSSYVDSEKQSKFIKKYKGKVIEFDCFVYYLAPSEKHETMYNYVLAPGDPEEVSGAVLFALQEINMLGFKWDSATRPEYLSVGSKIRIRAKVTTGEDSLYIYLKPEKTWGR